MSYVNLDQLPAVINEYALAIPCPTTAAPAAPAA